MDLGAEFNVAVTKAKKVLSDYSGFFDAAKKEAGYMPALKYALIINLVSLVILYASIAIGFWNMLLPAMLPFGANLLYLLPLFVYVFSIVGTFVQGFIIHLGAKLMGSKKAWSETYKTVVYASTPSDLFGWIPLFGILAGLWSLILLVIGVARLNGLTLLRGLGAVLVPFIILGVIALLIGAVIAALIVSTLAGLSVT